MEVVKMKSEIKIICVLTLLMAFLSTAAHSEEYQVKHAGALKNFKMKGDISAKFALQDLEGKPGLYALGAFAKLKGEIQIFDSIPYGCFVSDGKLAFDTSFNQKASLLVYAQVQSWQELSVPQSVSSHSQLEQFVVEAAVKRGLNIEKPFPFLINGKAKSLFWHVIDWDENDKEHSHQKHIESGPNGNLENTDVDVLGFYSTKHKGVFTHHTSNMHMHFITKDKTLAGHIDKLTPGVKMRLKLPIVK